MKFLTGSKEDPVHYCEDCAFIDGTKCSKHPRNSKSSYFVKRTVSYEWCEEVNTDGHCKEFKREIDEKWPFIALILVLILFFIILNILL